MIEVDSMGSADGDEARNESLIGGNGDSKVSQGITEKLNTPTEVVTELKDDPTLNPREFKEIRYPLDHGIDGTENEKRSASSAESRNWPFKKFSGTESREEAREWLNRINYFAKLNVWSNKVKLLVALRHLTGSARRRWFLQLDVQNTWTNFQRHFREMYVTEQSIAQKWQRLLQRRQEENEPTITYFADKLSLCKAVGLNLDQTKEQILIGIRSNEIYLQSAGCCHVQGNDLLKHILKMERMSDSRRRNQYEAEQRQKERLMLKISVAEYDTLAVPNFEITSTCLEKIKNVTCLSMLKNIFKCHAKRSSFRIIPESRKFLQVSKLCEVTADWAAAIIKTVIVNGSMKVLGLIDHGSSDCLMRESVARAGGWIPELGNFNGAIIIGHTVYAKELIYVHLTIDGVRAKVVPLLILPDEALPYPLMVGRSWMEQRCIGYIRDEAGFRFFYLTNFERFNDITM